MDKLNDNFIHWSCWWWIVRFKHFYSYCDDHEQRLPDRLINAWRHKVIALSDAKHQRKLWILVESASPRWLNVDPKSGQWCHRVHQYRHTWQGQNVLLPVNLFTTIHDGNFRRHSSMNVTIKWHKFSSNIYYIYVFFVIWSWKLR